MAEVSVGPALNSGFRLIGREPKAVAVWLAAYVVFTVVMWGLILLAAPQLFGQYLAVGRAGGAISTAQAEEMIASMSGLWAVLPVVLLLSLVFSTVFLGAIYRAVLQPDERRMAYVRFGRAELMLLLSAICWVLLIIVIYMVIMMGTGLVGGLIGTGVVLAGGPPAISGVCTVLAMLIGFVLTVWVLMRLVVSLPMSFDQARFVVLEGWRATRGAAWSMLGLGLSLLLITIVLEAAVGLVFFIVAGAASLGLAAAGGGLAGAAPLVVLWLAVMSAVGTAVFVILAAPAAEVYRQLKGEDVSVF
jgi:hypothetical protein